MKSPSSLFGKLEWRNNSKPFGFGTGPEADWKVILVSTLVLAALVISLSVYIFIKIDKGEIFLVNHSEETGARTLDAGVLRETLSYYRGKAAEFERLRQAPTPAVDPSL